MKSKRIKKIFFLLSNELERLRKSVYELNCEVAKLKYPAKYKLGEEIMFDPLFPEKYANSEYGNLIKKRFLIVEVCHAGGSAWNYEVSNEETAKIYVFCETEIELISEK